MLISGPRPARREFLAAAALAAPLALSPACSGDSEREPKVGPGEDLMREHGVLRRVLLVYEEAARRIAAGQESPAEVIASAAALVRRFVEDYHEKMEEDHIFPRMEKAGRRADLVRVLRVQHAAGREVTQEILGLTASPQDEAGRRSLVGAIDRFTRMYRPHAAREDTVLFPDVHELLGHRQYGELGETLEQEEKRILGEDGFERAVTEIGRLETSLGIHDLSRFTPA